MFIQSIKKRMVNVKRWAIRFCVLSRKAIGFKSTDIYFTGFMLN